jgi:hypothetical protein
LKDYTQKPCCQYSFALNIARSEKVNIKRRGAETFLIIFRKSKKLPFGVPGIQTKATTQDILAREIEGHC